MKTLPRFPFPAAVAVTLCAAATLSARPAVADTLWNWSYSGSGIAASGTLTASDAADAQGFHQITTITGSRNGDAIVGLFPTGSAIPGNEPYAIDNLIRLGPQSQITVHGFGFATAAGYHANPYFADFLATPGYMEVFTTTTPQSFSELPISFLATPAPEPASVALMIAGLGVVGMAATRRRRGNAVRAT